MPQVQSAGHRRRSLLLVLAKGGSELEDLLKLLVHTIDCHDGGGKPVTVSLRHRRDGFGPRAHLDMLGRGHGRGECERASEGVGAKGLARAGARVVEAMQRCGALVQSIRRLCPPETQQQLQQHLPNVVIEQAHQSLIQVHVAIVLLSCYYRVAIVLPASRRTRA